MEDIDSRLALLRFLTVKIHKSGILTLGQNTFFNRLVQVSSNLVLVGIPCLFFVSSNSTSTDSLTTI